MVTTVWIPWTLVAAGVEDAMSMTKNGDTATADGSYGDTTADLS